MMWWGHHAFGWGGMIIGALMMLLFWGGLFAVLWLVIRSATGSGKRQEGSAERAPDRALEILKERYARGEISKSEYEEMRRDIET